MARYPNQKTIKIKKPKCGGQFLQVGWEETTALMKKLGTVKQGAKEAFYIWCYFSRFSDGWVRDISPQDIMNETGISRTSYYRGVAALRDLGYMDDENFYVYGKSQTPSLSDEPSF